MKNAKQTAVAVEEVMNATNVTATAALEQVKKADANETAAVAEQCATGATANASSKKGAPKKKDAPKGKQGAKKAALPKHGKGAPKAKATKKKAPKAPAGKKETTTAREGSKKTIILDLLHRKQGATLAEIMKLTGWQAHSVRGFIAGTLGKKMDLPVESFKNEAGDRTYRVAK